MRDPEYPKIVSVDVIPSRPKPADVRKIHFIQAQEKLSLEEVALIVRIRLKSMPPATSQGFELYLGDYRVSKYWAFQGGIYFKVYNPRFLKKHGGKQIRFAIEGDRFYDTGLRLPKKAKAIRPAPAKDRTQALPSEEDVLNES